MSIHHAPAGLSIPLLDFTGYAIHIAPDGERTAYTFTPGLSPELTAEFDRRVEVARAAVSLTPAEWAAIRPQLQTLRDLRQMGRNAFMALTAAERDRLMYDAHVATTQVLLAILRD